MAQDRELNDDNAELLAALVEDALGGAGWTRDGIRGWRFIDELTERFPFAIDTLRPLLRAGLVAREDVLDPGRTTPLYLHRATQAGEDRLAARERRVPRPLPRPRHAPADAETLYLPANAWAGLSVLAAFDDPDAWVPATEIGERIRRTFFFEDGVYLERRGLVERRRPEATTRRNEPMRYRATALGRAARARDRRASATRVQVVVPGIALRPVAREAEG